MPSIPRALLGAIVLGLCLSPSACASSTESSEKSSGDLNPAGGGSAATSASGSGGGGSAEAASTGSGGMSSRGTSASSGDASAGDGGCTPWYVMHVVWGLDGGKVAYTDSSSLSPCGDYVRQRKTDPAAAPTLTCDATVDASTMGAIAALINDPVIQGALAAATVFGVDGRPQDSPVFRVSYGGKFFDVGSPCNGAPGCTEIPAKIQSLVDALTALDTAQLSQPPCQGVFP